MSQSNSHLGSVNGRQTLQNLAHLPYHAQSLTRPSLPVQNGLLNQLGVSPQDQQQRYSSATTEQTHNWIAQHSQNFSSQNSPITSGSNPASPWSIFENHAADHHASLYNANSPTLSQPPVAYSSPRDQEQQQQRIHQQQLQLQQEQTRREEAEENERREAVAAAAAAQQAEDDATTTTNDFINPLSYNLPHASGYESMGGIFHSSYGSYQPSVGPFARFLTPSPGPSVLGQLDDLDEPVEFNVDGPAPDESLDQQQRQDDDVTFDSIWKDFGRNDDGNNESDARRGDPFAGMVLANRSLQSSPKENPLALPSLNQPTNHAGTNRYEQSTMADHPPLPPSLPVGFAGGLSHMGLHLPPSSNSASPSFYQNTPISDPSPSSSTAPTPDHEPSTSQLPIKVPLKRGRPPKASLTTTNEDGEIVQLAKKPKKEKGGLSKKNRNPHATQLPGGNNVDANGGNGTNPVCSHCASVSTPLWRRGPDDELLCNACGLYQKLHQKPRPKGFLKQPVAQRGRNVLGVGTQAMSASTPPICSNCSATSTPMWRKDNEGRLNCNACSLYFKLHQIPRPVSLSQRRKLGSAPSTPQASTSSNASPTNPPPLPQQSTSSQHPPVLPIPSHLYPTQPLPTRSPSPHAPGDRSRSLSPGGEPRVPTPLVPSGALPPISSFTDDWSTMDRPPVLPMPNVDRPPVLPSPGGTRRPWDGARRNSPFGGLGDEGAQRFSVGESWERGLSPAGRVE